MINYIILVITIACTIFNVWLTMSERQGYDKGLEDGIRMTNKVLEEDQQTDCPCYAAPPDKALIIDRCGYCMGASFNDCEECERRRIYAAQNETMEG